MSLILEALKKSEARRQLGEAPGLGTPFTVARRRRSALPLFAALIVAAAAFGAWYLRRPAPAALDANTVIGGAAAKPVPNLRAALHPPSAPHAATMPAAGSPGTPASAPGGVTAPGAGVNGASPARPPMTIVASTGVMHPDAPRPVDDAIARRQRALAAGGEHHDPAAGARRAAAAPGVDMPAATRQPAAMPPSARPGTTGGFQSAAVPAAAAAAAARRAPQAAAPAPVAPAAAAAATRATPAVAAPAAPARPPAATAPAPAPAASNLPLYYELPYDVRKDLPPLVISMHVYAAAPAQRFIVVDGERKTEGESLKEGLTLREIRPDGVVLEFRGQRFFYPRPGR